MSGRHQLVQPLQRVVRWTPAQIDMLDQQILEVLAEDHPQSVRHVFYRMTDPRLAQPVPKSESGYDRVQARCVALRRGGMLPYEWLVDAKRNGHYVSTYADASDFVASLLPHYRADIWCDADVHVEVWVESRSIAGVLATTCRKLAVDLFPTGGFSSISFAHTAAAAINKRVTKPLVIYYIGDYDPAGVLIDRSLEAELRRHLAPGTNLSFERLAVSEAQIVEMDLPTKPRKEGDRRSPEVKATVEAEAMPAAALRQLLTDAVMQWLPSDALRVARLKESMERQRLIEAARWLSNGAN